MTDTQPYLPWPGANERIVVEEMVRDSISGHWFECHLFVKKRVQIQAKNIPQDQWEEIVQEAMIRLHQSLSTFEFRCTLKTWIFGIVRNCIIDFHRKRTREVQVKVPRGDPHDDGEHESEEFTTHTPRSLEDECITRDELRKALLALQEYVSGHANPERNGRILEIVLFEGHSLEEAAKAVGCSAPVAGYVVRSAQRYVREKLEHH